MLTRAELQTQLARYRAFLDDKLRADMRVALQRREEVLLSITQYKELLQTIDMMEEHGTSNMETKLDLGSQFYAQAVIPDPSRLFVDIGLGFHAELTLAEARSTIGEKLKLEADKVEVFTEKAALLQARIRVVEESIAELVQVSEQVEKEQAANKKQAAGRRR